MEIEMLLNKDDVSNLNYMLIYQTRFSSFWESGRVRRKYMLRFSPSERELAEKIFSYARRFSTIGLPESHRCSIKEITLWRKLEEFCGSI